MIKRYYVELDASEDEIIHERETGDWVLYEDIERELLKLDQAQDAINQWRKTSNAQDETIRDLKEQVQLLGIELTEKTSQLDNAENSVIYWRELCGDYGSRLDRAQRALNQIILGCGDDDETGALHYSQIDGIARRALKDCDVEGHIPTEESRLDAISQGWRDWAENDTFGGVPWCERCKCYHDPTSPHVIERQAPEKCDHPIVEQHGTTRYCPACHSRWESKLDVERQGHSVIPCDCGGEITFKRAVMICDRCGYGAHFTVADSERHVSSIEAAHPKCPECGMWSTHKDGCSQDSEGHGE